MWLLKSSCLILFFNFILLVSQRTVAKIHSNFQRTPTKQLMMIGLEFGMPFDIANTLSNPLGRTLTSLSLVGVSIFLALGIVLVPYNMVANFLDPEGVFSAPALLAVRRKRSILKESRPPPSYGTIHDYLDIEDGFSLLGENEPACRRRLVCDLHYLLTDVPVWVQMSIRAFSRNLNLGEYRQAALNGLLRKDCHIVYKHCTKSNMQILAQGWPNLKSGRRRPPYP
ncbi:uncharacterized protein LOC111708719 [Eurytemora carolleeae]|uniref:uncharacterized protein LOC111708719 n=1 Tax=Eurytemora carolleeae TaxID=1294199 RepID=UPI000C77F715|nr:uncharacterized protein LOC111708719 [Eurytemora carolleeae]XP_023337949.1 uncharacterized protein LOC111708719 [Eurytemora carolleeae]|eukprot:XP_023337948.1 uncharacterized protein LOC111708719 [Eurytemora affinis]